MPAQFIQESSVTNATSSANLTYTVKSGSSGNTLVLFIVTTSGNNNITISSVSLSNVTWTNYKVFSMNAVPGHRVFVLYGTISGGASGTTLSVNFSAAVTFGSIVDLTEWGGVLVPTGVDSFGDGTGGAVSTVSSNNLAQCTTTQGNELLVALAAWAAPAITVTSQPGGNYQNLNSTSDGSQQAIQVNYSTFNSPGNQSPSWGLSGSGIRNVGFVFALEVVNGAMSLMGVG